MMTFDLDKEAVETLYYALAHAEMMWRQRSHNPDIDSHGSYADTPKEFEATCRAEMKRYRTMQKALELQLPSDFWETDVDTILENWDSEDEAS